MVRVRRALSLSAVIGALLLTLQTSPGNATPAAEQLAVLRVNADDRIAVDTAAPVIVTTATKFRQGLQVRADGRLVDARVRPLPLSSQDVVLVISPGEDLASFRGAIVEFLLQLPPGTRAAILSAGPEAQILQPLTADVSQLVQAVSLFRSTSVLDTKAGIGIIADLDGLRSPRTIIFLSGASTEFAAGGLELLADSSAVYDVRVGGIAMDTPRSSRVQRISVSVPTRLLGALDAIVAVLSRQYRVTVEDRPQSTLQLALTTGDTVAEAVIVVRQPRPSDASPTTEQRAQQALTSDSERRFDVMPFIAALAAVVLAAPLFLLVPAGANIKLRSPPVTAPLLRRLLPVIQAQGHLCTAATVIATEARTRDRWRLRMISVALRRPRWLWGTVPVILSPLSLRDRDLIGAAVEWSAHRGPCTATAVQVALCGLDQRAMFRRLINPYGSRVRLLTALMSPLPLLIGVLGQAVGPPDASLYAVMLWISVLGAWNAVGCYWLWRTGRFPFSADPRDWWQGLGPAAEGLELRAVRAAAEPEVANGPSVADDLLSAAAEARRADLQRVNALSGRLPRQALVPLLTCVLPSILLALVVLL